MNDKRITRHTLTSAAAAEDKTDWERLAASDGYDGEIIPEDEFDWTNAVQVHPEPKKLVSLRIDPDILAFFKEGGKGYQTRINAVLRAYMKAKSRD